MCEAGSQELHLTADRLHAILQSYGITDYSRSLFEGLEDYPDGARVSSRVLYSLLGCEDYASLDLGGQHDSIQHDLNRPFEDRDHWGRYDLVTDFGCNEHCFNIMEAYRTLHRILKPGGLMVINQARYMESNGYYLLDESFYEGLAAANGYEIIRIFYCVISTDLTSEQLLLPFHRDVIKVLDLNRALVSVVCCFRKTKPDDFEMPYQGKFLAEIAGNAGYFAAVQNEPVARHYVPLRSHAKVIEWVLSQNRISLIEELLKRFPDEMAEVLGRRNEAG